MTPTFELKPAGFSPVSCAVPAPGALPGGLRTLALVCLLALLALLSGCGYNQFQSLDEQVKADWSEVLNQYKRRADLIPNIVSTVQGEASFERGTLEAVVNARSKATSIQATPELLNDPEAFKRFQEAQSQLTGALSRLMAVSENYPNLKANQGFQDLRVQLEGTENRITVARNKYILAIKDYNILARSFPTNLTAKMMGYGVKPTFTVEDEATLAKPPAINFGATPGAPPAPAPAPAPAAATKP